MSARSSSSDAPCAAVRTMKPPCPFSRSLMMMRFRRWRSSSAAIFARHAGVIHRGHVDQEASGQRDVAGNAGALLADGFFCDLNQNFLTFFEQFGDQRHVLRFADGESVAHPRHGVLADRGEDQTPGRGARWVKAAVAGRSANFHPGVDGAVASSLGIEERFGFGLGFFKFGFFGFLCFLLGDCFVDF